MIYLISVIVSFLSCFLKGFQNKNVAGSHVKAAYCTTWALAIFDVAAVTLIIKGGWPIAVSSGFGASLGIVTAIKMHDRIFRK